MRKEAGMAVALALVCVVIGISNADFFGQANVLNTTRQIAMLGTFAIGVSFVIITGGIDLSVGSIIGLTGVIIAKIAAPGPEGASLPIWLGITVAMTVALLVGLAQGLLITRLKLQPFIVTLAGMLMLRGCAQTICRGGTISFGASPFRSLADEGWIDRGGWYLLSYPVLIFLVVALVFTYVLHFTVFGRHVFAIGGNREAAEYSGINVKRVETATYVISAGLSGLAGVVYAAYIGQMSHTVGSTYELIAIAAAVLGGCSLRGGEGTVFGIIIGSTIMKVIENGINMFKISYTGAAGEPHEWRLDTNWRYIIIGAVILIAVVLDQLMHVLEDQKKELSMNRNPNILVVGSINMDLVLRMLRIPLEGESLIGNDYGYIPGGKGANQAVAAALLGATVSFTGRIGNDSHGIQLKALLEDRRISTELLTIDDHSPTGLAVVMLASDGQNRIIVFPGANMAIQKEDIHKAFEKDFDAVMLQFEVPAQIVVETCRLAKEKRIPIIVDAGPAQDFPLEDIRGVEILSPNETETRALCGIEIDTAEKAEEAARTLRHRTDARHVVIKMGKKGAFVWSEEKARSYPAPDVQVVDTTAAGDAFTAAMTLEYLQHRDIHRAVRFANIVGAITVTKLGAQPSLPAMDEVKEFAETRGLRW